MSYYLQDHPNPNTPQYGWERAKLGQPGTHLSGVVGVHTSEAITDFEGVDNNAENNAAFLGRRTDYGSYHTTGDADSILPLIHPRYAAWADTTNNAHAMSVSGCLQAARWLEMTPERRRAVVINMAVAAARMVQTAVADGYLAKPTPAVRISAAEAIAGSRPGFYGHGVTNPGTRYDPGQHFDWDLFLATYAAAIGGGITYQGSTTEEDFLMALSDDEQRRILAAADRINGVITDPTAKVLTEAHLPEVATHVLNKTVPRGGAGASLGDGLTSLGALVAWNDDHTIQVLSAVAASAAQDGASVEEIQAAVKDALKSGVVKVEVSVEGSSHE